MKVLHVVGARPNFMKAAPVYRALARIALRGERRDANGEIVNAVCVRHLAQQRHQFHGVVQPVGVGSPIRLADRRIATQREEVTHAVGKVRLDDSGEFRA